MAIKIKTGLRKVNIGKVLKKASKKRGKRIIKRIKSKKSLL